MNSLNSFLLEGVLRKRQDDLFENGNFYLENEAVTIDITKDISNFQGFQVGNKIRIVGKLVSFEGKVLIKPEHMERKSL